MQYSVLPSYFTKLFADSGSYNTIPSASQISITPGAASLTDGFPPLTRTPLAAGGVPPFGEDMNGILRWLSQVAQQFQAGAMMPYNSAFATAIGGYPKGALVRKSDGSGYWQNTVDMNTTDPDGGGAAGWKHFAVLITNNAGSALIPTGTTAQRDSSPTAGYFRFNATASRMEYFDGTNWLQIPPINGGEKSLLMPTGTTAQRDTSPTIGYTRFNSTLSRNETFDGAEWKQDAISDDLTDLVHVARMATAETNITTNSANITTNAANITTNSANITTLTSIVNSKAPIPTSSAGVGQWAVLTQSGGVSTLPSGGTWAYFGVNNGSGFAGVAAGGTQVWSGTASGFFGFYWRIA